MIIENIAIRKKSPRPTPHYMQMLRLVGIYPKVVSKQDAENERDTEEKRRKQPIGFRQCPTAAMIRKSQLSKAKRGATQQFINEAKGALRRVKRLQMPERIEIFARPRPPSETPCDSSGHKFLRLSNGVFQRQTRRKACSNGS
jgi:hypothetical protein